MEEPTRNYWKEIVGTAMWIALILFLLASDRIPGCTPARSADPRPPSVEGISR